MIFDSLWDVNLDVHTSGIAERLVDRVGDAHASGRDSDSGAYDRRRARQDEYALESLAGRRGERRALRPRDRPGGDARRCRRTRDEQHVNCRTAFRRHIECTVDATPCTFAPVYGRLELGIVVYVSSYP